jgi:hypothetical protein
MTVEGMTSLEKLRGEGVAFCRKMLRGGLPVKYVEDVTEDAMQSTMTALLERHRGESDPFEAVDRAWFFGQLKGAVHREMGHGSRAGQLDDTREDTAPTTSVLGADSENEDPAVVYEVGEEVIDTVDADLAQLEVQKRREYAEHYAAASRRARAFWYGQEPWVRKAIVRRLIGGHDQKSVASYVSAKFGLNITHGAVRTAVSRFKKRLEAYLGSEVVDYIRSKHPPKDSGGRPPTDLSDRYGASDRSDRPDGADADTGPATE